MKDEILSWLLVMYDGSEKWSCERKINVIEAVEVNVWNLANKFVSI